MLPTLLRVTFPSTTSSPSVVGTGPTGYVRGHAISSDSTAADGRECHRPNGKPVRTVGTDAG